jgi:hypothetical protein
LPARRGPTISTNGVSESASFTRCSTRRSYISLPISDDRKYRA